MKESQQFWIDQALYDLETARAMLNSGRYLYVLFCCQQSVEKAIKAEIIRGSGKSPPRIHALSRLAELAEFELEPSQLDFIAELSIYYLQTRYPEQVSDLAKSVTKQRAQQILSSTEAFIEWLHSTKA